MKGLLAAADASLVERSFQHQIHILAPETHPKRLPPESDPSRERPASSTSDQHDPSAANDENPISQSTSSEHANDRELVKLRRSRDKDHLLFIANQACTVCGRRPCEAHHIRYAQPRALGRKVSDEFTVPLCRVHHRELHRQGDERAWWAKFKIDPMPMALRFWQETRGVATGARSANKESASDGTGEAPTDKGTT